MPEVAPITSATPVPGDAGPAPVLVIRSAEYDDATDRLRLTTGRHAAVAAAPTPEGHIVRRAVGDGELCGVVITDLRRRLREDARVDVTLGSGARLSLGVEEIATLLTRASPQRLGRFARASG